MAKGVNKVILLGNLGNDPEFTQTTSGLQVAKCSLATSKTWNDDKGQRQEKTEWHRVVFFNRLAEIVSQYLKKGMQIYVEGELRTNSWEKDGVTRYSTEIVAREMQMLGGKQSSGSSGLNQDQYDQEFADSGKQSKKQSFSPSGQTSDSSSGPADSSGQPEDDIDQDIPF